MAHLCLPYLPSTLVWTKISLDNYSYIHPTYLSKKFAHFGINICYYIGYEIKIFIIKEAYKVKLWLRMNSNKENPFRTTLKTFWPPTYLGLTLLLLWSKPQPNNNSTYPQHKFGFDMIKAFHTTTHHSHTWTSTWKKNILGVKNFVCVLT